MSKMSKLSRGAAIAVAMALTLSALVLSSAFAKGIQPKSHVAVAAGKANASATASVSAQMLENDWKSELSSLRFDQAILGRLDRFFSDLRQRSDRDHTKARADGDDTLSAKLGTMVHDAEALLVKAQQVATTHAGFDANGKVTDQTQALSSEQTLAKDLGELRAMVIYRLEHLFK